jgi:hypothetical protein
MGRNRTHQPIINCEDASRNLKGVTAKMQIDKLYFCHFLASQYLIYIICGPTPNNVPLIIREGIIILRLDAMKPRNGKNICCPFSLLLLHPLG